MHFIFNATNQTKEEKNKNQTEQTNAHHIADAHEYLLKKNYFNVLKMKTVSSIRMFSFLQAKTKN